MILQDLRYGVRMILRSPGFTAVAVLSLGFGIGANTAIFSVIDGLLLKGLPVRDPDQLVMLRATHGAQGYPIYYEMFQKIRDHNDIFSGVSAILETNRSNITIGRNIETGDIQVAMVSGDYFSN